ncbi:alpha/beta fold hydrolase [Thermodesulfobacteriota bacterium]
MSIIQVNHIELYYEEYGDGSVPIVFGHGFLSSLQMWKHLFIDYMPNSYHAYAWDMRGHGRSCHIKQGCNIIQLADDLYHFIQHLKLAPCIYVGLSMGGGVGLQLALNNPAVLKGMVLMNTVSGFGLLGPTLGMKLMQFIAGKRWLLKPLLKSMFIHSPSEQILENMINDAILVSRETFAQWLNPSNTIENMDRLREMDVPTLVMIGENDKVLPVNRQHRLADTLPNAEKIVFNNQGHAMIAEIPKEVFQSVYQFTEKLL